MLSMCEQSALMPLPLLLVASSSRALSAGFEGLAEELLEMGTTSWGSSDYRENMPYMSLRRGDADRGRFQGASRAWCSWTRADA
jgi:hypothetical protein